MTHLLVILPIFLMTVVIHEVSHGWVANRLGDPTAKARGRLSLNPLRHVDPIGTVLLPFILMMTHAPIIFGWAKPVPIDVSQLHSPKRDLIWVGLAGPAANLALAAVLAAVMRGWHLSWETPIGGIVGAAIIMNVVLGIFNLVPVPPLDGSRVLVGLLPSPAARWVAALEPFGFLIVIALLLMGVIQRLVGPAVAFALRVLGVAAP